MKLNYEKIVRFVNVSNGMVGKKLPLKLSFALKRNRQLASEAVKPYNEELKNILKEHEDDEEGAAKMIEDLLAEEVDLNIKTVSEEVIEKTETDGFDKLTLGELEAIEFMTEE